MLSLVWPLQAANRQVCIHKNNSQILKLIIQPKTKNGKLAVKIFCLKGISSIIQKMFEKFLHQIKKIINNIKNHLFSLIQRNLKKFALITET